MTDEEINNIIANETGLQYKDFCNTHEEMLKAEDWLMDIDVLSWDEYYCSFEKGLCCSTTSQRAENFLKAIGKWKE